MLSYLPGTVGNYPLPGWMWSPTILHEAGSLLRRIHGADVPLAHLAATWQLPAHEPIEAACLNDVAPYNMVFQDGHLTGLIDVDMASPGPRIWNLAYLAYRLVPLGEYADRDVPGEDARPGRLDALIRSYGYDFDQDRDALLAQDATRQLDSMAVRLHLDDESDYGRLRGSSSLAKKDAAALRMSFVSRRSRFSRLRRLISSSSSLVGPVRSPALACAWDDPLSERLGADVELGARSRHAAHIDG
ncbi:Phosphotransferase enzyme family protein [Cryobacterium flavum]|uniref:Phosphotransferase enzyme family protein n=1 Tax=Cryobacterium flavum TaxID=1424659 RepID=A0A4R8UY27_9MICO|nr:phosphotransferase [Cryobacterium flavum]TFB73124.1 hypothetical protein E3O21_18865 [Cryobacterium flavum]SDM98155.1 Phosphotransferase enzyme family protein [Cryobacterium flavum]